MTVIVDRDGGNLDRTRRLGPARFEQAVRREIAKRGGQKLSLRILRNLFAALDDPARVLATGAAPSSGCSCCWRTGRTTSTSSPTPSTG
jgi:hypothetical protein